MTAIKLVVDIPLRVVFLLALTLGVVPVNAAPDEPVQPIAETAVNDTDSPAQQNNEKRSEPIAQEETETIATTDDSAPQDTRDGSGLKDKKLSVIFEQFVPSETISADNAVPFPTDI